MKTKLLLFAAVVCLMMAACNDEPASRITDEDISAEQAELVQKKIIYEGYLPLVDGQYILKMSEAEAENVGINKTTYRYFREKIDEGNVMLREMMERMKNDPTVTSIGEMQDRNETYKSEQENCSEATRATLPYGI